MSLIASCCNWSDTPSHVCMFYPLLALGPANGWSQLYLYYIVFHFWNKHIDNTLFTGYNPYRCAIIQCSSIQLSQFWHSFHHRQCGLRPPTNPLEVDSSGNIMLVNLVTDVVQKPGFKAVYSAIPATTGKTCNHSVQMLSIL